VATAQGEIQVNLVPPRRYQWARAYRAGRLVCGRVDLTIAADMRLGLAPRERCCIAARFLERLHPGLRADLAELARRRGAAARRVADRVEPIELVFDDTRLGRQRIVAWIEPPRVRSVDLRDTEFGLRPPAS
jgi:hypothetical protein